MTKAQSRTRPVARPIAILVDRSRDAYAADGLVGLEPDDRYQTTDSRVPLRAGRLASYDVLVVAGHALAAYRARELAAIARFVRRGGGLLLAASAGVFEHYAERPASDMAVSAVARRFGIEFLPPSAVAGSRTLSHDLVDGYPPEAIRLHNVSPLRGLVAADAWLTSWSPVRSGRGGSILVSHRRTGEAAGLAVPFGKGRVVAFGSASFLDESPLLCRRLMDYLAARSPRRRGERRPPDELAPPPMTRRQGNVEITYHPATAGRVHTVLRLARKVLPALDALIPAKKPRRWRIELNPSCTLAGHEWWAPGGTTIRLGADASDAQLAFAMGSRPAEVLAWRTPIGWRLRESVLGGRALRDTLGLAAMRAAGFQQEAERLADEFARESRRRFRDLDAGGYYGHGAESPGLWLWRELARCQGEDILRRFFRAIPKKLDLAAAPEAVFTPLDVVAHFLSRAARADLYPWFASLGATVHPLPLARFGSPAFKRGVRRALWRQLRDRRAAASERADAVEALIARQEADKKPLREAANQLASPDAALRLVGAARLARARDSRGRAALSALARGRRDASLAAVAQLLLIELGDRGAAGPLVRSAPALDARFQLDVAHHLGRLGDPRAAQFTLDGLRRRLGPKAASLEIPFTHDVDLFSTVNGRRVANILSGLGTDHLPGNTHVSRLSVYWVHTGSKFRRKGLARVAMARLFEDPRVRRCSCARLGTGTRNTAHALYRDFGFVDARLGDRLTFDLKREMAQASPKGIRVRRARPGDEAGMARLFNASYGDFFCAARRRATQPSSRSIWLVAHRGRRLAAFVGADVDDEHAHLFELAVGPGKKRDEAAAALLAALHRLLKKQGAKSVSLYQATDTLAPLLQPLGYRSEKSGGVSMFALLNLPQFLQEIAPLLERRLAKSDWTGTLALRGETHAAGLTVRNGRVIVHRRPPARADLTLAGTDAALTRIVAGVHTPLEPYLQLDLTLSPALTPQTLQLLETLFPRVEAYR